MLSLVTTTTTMNRCTDFINKLREFRFIKIRDRGINKFNTLMGYKDRETTTQSPANNNQLQAPNNLNKWGLGVTAYFGPFDNSDSWDWVRGVLDKLITHLFELFGACN